MKTFAMDLKEKVQKLDELTSEGKIMEALEKFYHPELITQEGNQEPVVSKQSHKEKLTGFFEGISSVNGITLHNSTVGENVSMSEFTFDMEQKNGDKILWNEILRREWKDGLVIHERYYTAG